MELETVACNNCGAPLDVPESAKFVVCAHCDSRLAVHRTENARYTEVIEQLQKQTAELGEDLEILRLRQELSDAEQQWDRTRQAVLGNRSGDSLPSVAPFLIGGTVGIGMVIMGCVMSFEVGLIWPGSVLTVIMGFLGVLAHTQRESLRYAKQRYERKRARLHWELDRKRSPK